VGLKGWEWKKSIRRAKNWLSKAEVSEDGKALTYGLLAAAELQRLKGEGVRSARRRKLLAIGVVSVIISLLLFPTTLKDNILLIEKKKHHEQRVYFSFSTIRPDLGDVQFWEYVEPSSAPSKEESKVVKKAIRKVKKQRKSARRFQVIKLVEVGMRELYKNKGAFTMKGGN